MAEDRVAKVVRQFEWRLNAMEAATEARYAPSVYLERRRAVLAFVRDLAWRVETGARPREGTDG